MLEDQLKFVGGQELWDFLFNFGVWQIQCDIIGNQLLQFEVMKKLVQAPDSCFFDMNRWLLKIGDELDQMRKFDLTDGVNRNGICEIAKFIETECE